MLKIRLAKTGRNKVYTYKIVLTEHSKPAKTGFITVLGWFDAKTKNIKFDEDAIKKHIGNGAQPTPRVAKELYKETNDEFYAKYIPAHKNSK